MSDNLNVHRPQDPKKIKAHEIWKLGYWSEKSNVTKEQLIAAVEAVETQVTDVAKYLGK